MVVKYTLHMLGGQREQPWEDLVKSWYGDTINLPCSSTSPGFVLISEKYSRIPRCSRTVLMNNVFASLTILSSHLKITKPYK